MKTTFLKSSCLFLLVVVAFVYFAKPIYAKASTADLDYIETDMTTSEVAELFAVPAAFIPAALVIIGFIVLTYCTLRNIQVPVSYSSQTSFLDKCTQLGQFVVDNATDPIKNFLYSVYTYAQDNNLTSITGIAAFTAVHIGMFFRAIAQWIGSSLISNVSGIGQGLLDQFKNSPFANLSYLSQADEQSAVNSLQLNYPNISLDSIFGGSNQWITVGANTLNIYVGVELLNSSTLFLYFYQYNSDNQLVRYPFSFSYYDGSLSAKNQYYIRLYNPAGYFSWITSVFSSLAYPVFVADSYPATLDPADITLVNDVVTTPWSDQIYQPSDDELEIDPDGIGEVLGGALAGLTLGELINLLTQGKTLTLDSALDSQKIVGGGDYVFPSMDGIWKYPQYFFDMLKGWGSFVGGCLSAVTVGDGGLSWIFYGGFVLLICGGIIGKILLG